MKPFTRKAEQFYRVKSALFGVAVGDALGVPLEFIKREVLKQNPVVSMREFGTHAMPKGTWSDDSALTFCLAEALTEDFKLQTVGNNFVKWYQQGFWTPYGDVFDIGFTTLHAIRKIMDGVPPELAGASTLNSNGNGSLMRILPFVFSLMNEAVEKRFAQTKQISAITHGHFISVFSCFYYLEFARLLILGKDKFESYHLLQNQLTLFLSTLEISVEEKNIFNRLLVDNIYEKKEDEIQSDGYVVHTLEASIWCLLKTKNYREAVLKAVNLGEDTDTTASVTGGLSGLLYGYDSIPVEWLNVLNSKEKIEDSSKRVGRKIQL